ncbi:conserved hypothetical protein [Talaromyces stipitatus ATCC 10500]|uniref:Life-span regulatory factor domain-containing protein n=1 Tax=Talaromyces stipitatus (strain ATCC 10500 / CBS 375.48 / QM 6759 / NRRL 1006) TaxID=441959 RepID=B8M2P3_TALSN|nr:uncharacterized protein TSTA_091960 [Talaromyces stipitatus ATCC 10500]EED21954.1 conserved hypothetical protein [Talaromyces stipitatus ATCC 10500]
MHRQQQKPHTRGTTNTSPPSTKRPPLHRHTSSPVAKTTPTPTPTPAPSPTSPTPKKGSAIKPQRPALYHRKTASAHFHHPQRNKSHQSLGRLLGAGSGPASYSVKPEVEHFEMATSFLQYCAMCEKQITVPSNSVLYCSESCRRKDSCKPLSASSYTYTMTSSPSSPINIDTSSSIMSTTPTSKPIPVSRPLVARIPSDLHDAKSDLDPTEWKPIISGGNHRHGRDGSSTSLASSDAWNYLSQFHHPRGQDERISSSTPSSSMPLFRRPPTARNSTSSLSTMAPSLVNTPSTTTASSSVTGSPPSSSSMSSASEYISAAIPSYGGYGNYTSTSEMAVAGMMDPSRPLPPRHNPSFSNGGAGATKGVELVVPHIMASAEEEDGHVQEGIWMRV